MTTPITIDEVIIRVLHVAPDGRTAPEIADILGTDYPEVTIALHRLLDAGLVGRSRTRLAAWVATSRPAGGAP